jgi:hypothetical protein
MGQVQFALSLGFSRVQLVLRVLLLVAACAAIAGCEKSPFKLYPVSGKVLFKGQPAEGAQVVFQPAAGTSETAPKPPLAFGTVQADGSFKLYTDPYGSGAPAGDYVVLITWYGENPRNPEQKINRLPPKYADPTAPLLKVTVKQGQNDLEPFQLKS